MEPRKLVEQAKKGDKEAFGKLYSLYLKKIYRFILFSVRSKELAEDLTQTTFYKALLALPNFSSKSGSGSFQAWLFAIARNLVIDESRRKKEIRSQAVGEILDNLVWEDPARLLDQNDTKKLVWQALGQLKQEEKSLIVLRFFEELKYEEIAKIVKKSPGNSRVMIHRILKKLRIILEEK